MKILQWNCQSLRSKRAELEKRSIDYDIILLSETWLGVDDRFLLRGFDVVHLGRTDRRGGGVAVIVRNGIKYKIIDNLYNMGFIIRSNSPR